MEEKIILRKKGKIYNEILPKTIWSNAFMLFISLPIWVSNSSEVWQWIWEIQPLCQKCVKTGRELALNKIFFQYKQIFTASKRLKLSKTDLHFFEHFG